MQKQRGMTAIVTVVILVALVLVAIAIVWAVISGIIGGATDSATFNNKCLNVELKITSAEVKANGNSWNATISIKREMQGEDIDGVAVILENNQDTSEAFYESENIEYPGTLQVNNDSIVGLTGNPTKIKVVPYFLKGDGTKFPCANAAERFVTIA